eukprot:3627370-Rhodomonas_salina.1
MSGQTAVFECECAERLYSSELPGSEAEFKCHACPKGAVCENSAGVQTCAFNLVSGNGNTSAGDRNSTADQRRCEIVGNWTRRGEDGIYILNDCPAGHFVDNGGEGLDFNAAQQACMPCGKGEDCHTAPCSTCTACDPGRYKANEGSNACDQCPADTYRTLPGATALAECTSCPDNADTGGLVGQTALA